MARRQLRRVPRRLAQRHHHHIGLPAQITQILRHVLLAGSTKELDGGEQTLFRWTLALAAVSAVVYGVSVQLWEEAIGSGYSIENTLKLRIGALVLSTTAWFTLAWALVLAVITVDTSLGAFAGLSGVVATVYTAESKHRLARDENPDVTTDDSRPPPPAESTVRSVDCRITR